MFSNLYFKFSINSTNHNNLDKIQGPIHEFVLGGRGLKPFIQITEPPLLNHRFHFPAGGGKGVQPMNIVYIITP